MQSFTRRAVLGLGGLLALAIHTKPARTLARVAVGRHRGLARVVDANRDGNVTIDLGRARPPAGKGRGRVIEVTSEGEQTGDYAISLVNLMDEPLGLGDLVDRGFGYDFLAGEANESACPDEVWILLRGSGGGMGPRGFHPVFRTEDLGEVGQWNHRDVSREIRGSVLEDGTNQEWKAFDLLNHEVDRIGRDLLARFGPDAAVEAVGIGRGTPSTGPSTIECYYDDFVVAGTEYRLPVPGRATGNGRGPPDG